MYRTVCLTAALLLGALAAPRLDAAELKIFSPGSTEVAFGQLLPQFEKISGHKISIEYGPVGALAARVGKGEAVDLAILSEPATEALRRQGKLVAGSTVEIAKVGIGVFVRKGDPKPDISSVDAFLRALLECKSCWTIFIISDILGVAKDANQMRVSLLVCPLACAMGAILLWLGSRARRAA